MSESNEGSTTSRCRCYFKASQIDGDPQIDITPVSWPPGVSFLQQGALKFTLAPGVTINEAKELAHLLFDKVDYLIYTESRQYW